MIAIMVTTKNGGPAERIELPAVPCRGDELFGTHVHADRGVRVVAVIWRAEQPYVELRVT